MVKYIDIHTHDKGNDITVYAIKNIISNQQFTINSNQFYSVGLHPWYLNENTKNTDFQLLTEIANHKNILAIGEIGLDRITETDFELQQELFGKQILLAEKLQKPIIIHCVRAFYDIITIKKNLNPKVPFIIHGFDQNDQIFNQLLNHNFYFSYGAAIFNLNSNAFWTIQKTPLDRLFLETDNANISIKEIYQQAASAMQISENQLIEQLKINYMKMFGTLL